MGNSRLSLPISLAPIARLVCVRLSLICISTGQGQTGSAVDDFKRSLTILHQNYELKSNAKATHKWQESISKYRFFLTLTATFYMYQYYVSLLPRISISFALMGLKCRRRGSYIKKIPGGGGYYICVNYITQNNSL